MAGWKRLGLLVFVSQLCLSAAAVRPAAAVGARPPAPAAQSARVKELQAVRELYGRAYTLFAQDKDVGRALFKQAAGRLRNWIKTYEKDPDSLSFLLYQARLGLYLEAAGMKKEAERAYRVCLRHRLLDSRDAVLRVCRSGGRPGDCRGTKTPVSEIVNARLGLLTAKTGAAGGAGATHRRTVSKSGSSKGRDDEPLPPLLVDEGEGEEG